MRRRLSRATGFGRQLPPPEGPAVRASSQIEDAVYGRYADCSPGPRQGGVQPRGCDHSLRLVRSTPCCVPLIKACCSVRSGPIGPGPKANGRPVGGPRQLYLPDVPLNPTNFGASMQTRYRYALERD